MIKSAFSSAPRYESPEEARGKFRVDAIWDCNAPKYRVACGQLHVTKATKYIGMTQLFVIALFSVSLLFAYTSALKLEENQTKEGSSQEWSINYYMARYVSSLLSALTLQLGLVLMMLHGIRTNRRSLLIPYIGFAAIALFLAIFQISIDIINFVDTKSYQNMNSENPASAILIHFTGVLVHVWCMKVVCKCYSFYGDKNVAEAIGQQLQSTSVAFAVDFTRPPPYSRLPTDVQPLTQA
ncbi:hypothetical protein CAEBREN_01528 [Caenorhabditis brenneri]|uniref:Uncharacterized protein n=1 Tax=Caenorhabditis brenneri TaxID=135651 RepID=G0P3J1_CAEBE|nr:hypothetical protein CAEBREN_00813 [Caenorhabditis brenneri]EGT43973.1 hypothetical protein CAEBREN_01528 [Caenorhabditis brenneri]